MQARAILRETAHRPWPLPRGPWVMRQTWHELLFAHWAVAPEALARLLPAPLAPALDTFDGRAWVGVVPFRMSGVRPRGLPSIPWLSEFLELNVRTYVTVEGKPGVFFFSLDAANPVAVRLARALFHLPYFTAAMQCRRSGGRIEYGSRAEHAGEVAVFEATYGPIGPAFRSRPGTLEHFLTERYCLYATGPRGHVYCGEIHHVQWPLQPAEAEVVTNTLAASHGIGLPDTGPLLHYAERLDVLVWAPCRVG